MTGTVVEQSPTTERTRSLDAIGRYFEALGQGVERKWATRRNNEEFFPAVAGEVLAETPVPPDADAIGILEFLTSRHRLVPQEDFGFGEPPVTLYRSRDFRISALYWLDGTTSVHQHKFSGAFRVLEGSSIHVEYDFSPQETITGRILVGDLRHGRAELLQRGEVRQIVAGSAFIHALFHLNRPSVTVVVRTDRQDMSTPQFEYFRPGLAFDPFYKDETLIRQLSGLRTMHEFAPMDALRCAREMISASDFFGGFLTLRSWFGVNRADQLDDLIEHFIRIHGSVADILWPVFADQKRQHAIMIRRRLVQEAMHRLFLALVLNLPDRASVDSILLRMFPEEEPADLLARWVEELSSPEHRGVSGLHLSGEEVRAVTDALHAPGSGFEGAMSTLGSRVRSTPLLEALLR